MYFSTRGLRWADLGRTVASIDTHHATTMSKNPDFGLIFKESGSLCGWNVRGIWLDYAKAIPEMCIDYVWCVSGYMASRICSKTNTGIGESCTYKTKP